MNPNYTDITFIIDRSTSMMGSEDDTIRGYNQFMSDQKKVEGKCRATTVLFDSTYKFLHENTPISEVPELDRNTYQPQGWTALYDAFGIAMQKAGKRFAAMKESERPSKVLFVVLTDGHENSSKEINQKQLGEMIKTQGDTYNWDFVFLGADFDAFASYGNLGIVDTGYGNVDKKHMFNAIQQLGVNTTTYRKSARSVNAEEKTSALMSGVADGSVTSLESK